MDFNPIAQQFNQPIAALYMLAAVFSAADFKSGLLQKGIAVGGAWVVGLTLRFREPFARRPLHGT